MDREAIGIEDEDLSIVDCIQFRTRYRSTLRAPERRRTRRQRGKHEQIIPKFFSLDFFFLIPLLDLYRLKHIIEIPRNRLSS